MRLLKLQDGKLSLIKFDKDCPKYAIMSHTWGAAEDEVQFDDVAQGKAEYRKGYEKIKFCAKQAASHNLEYFWIDTCCINKADLQEFQSAINLMFRWYQNAEICLVYMADVATDSAGLISKEPVWKEAFRNSRWFTRSWTLQELLSPRKIEFYSREHQCLGNRASLEAELHLITGIPASALCGTGLSQFSTEQRISWAQGRDSTFEEDQAYSLLGLCGVSMAPNYGEGAKAAFKRLRKRCDKKLSSDASQIIGNFVIRTDLTQASRSQQISSPGSSFTALAAMFGTCLDAMRNIDTHSNHGTDLSATVTQFGADMQVFKDWGKAVGIDGQKLGHDHHENLDDPKISSAIQRILVIIQDIADTIGEESSDQQHGLEATTFRGRAQDSRQLRLGKSGEVAARIEWTSRQKARFLALSERFGSLVRNLQALLPMETSKIVDLVAGQAQRGYLLSDNYAVQRSVRGISDASNQLDLQQIILESKKRLERDMKRELDSWLGASFTIATYSDSIQKKLPDTCDWIMDREVFHDWESAGSCAKVLWINGPAGYGKTVLSAWIVQHLKARNDVPLAFFFFSADLEDRADPFVVIRSWISQIASQNQDAFDLAYRKLEAYKGQSVSSMEMMELFKEIIQKVPNCTCIVDGLDECSSKGGWATIQSNTLATFIRMTIQSLVGTTSRVLIVSRDDQQIRKGFVEMSSVNTGIKMLQYKITPDDVKPDAIKLSSSLVDQKLNKKSTALRAEIAKRIVDRCDSMFLRIKLLENDIRSGKNQRQLERIVDQAPTELHNLYDRNWARIMSRGNDSARALAILRWVAFGLRPITILEMTEALLLTDFEDVDDLEDELPDEIDEPYIQTEILELCESLVETRAGASDNLGLRTLHLTHFTVRQYILLHLPTDISQLQAERDITSSNESAQHNILAEACLRYLGISSLWHKGDGEEVVNELRGSFRNYAMESWNKHAKIDSHNYSTVSKLIVSFFCSANDSWEAWRKYFEAGLTQSKMLQYEGDITKANRLFYATLLGLQDVFEALIKDLDVDVNHVDESNRTALLAAAHEGRLDLLQTLLQKHADINKASNLGRTPLYVASNNGHIGIVKFLLEKGADLTITNKYGWTPLNSASSSGHVDVVKLLLENGADFTIVTVDKRSPLDSASDGGHVEVVKLLLEKGADYNTVDNDGWTPLRTACFSGHVGVVKLLLEKSADLSIADKNGWTPLNSACDKGHLEVVKLLLEKGADYTIADNDGWTPLRAACFNGYTEVVRLLLEKGCDLSIVDKKGWTPLNSACDKGHLEVVKLLLEKGADLAVANNNGWTPLNSACDNGHIELVKLLLEKGADLTVTDINGWTPFNCACDSGHIGVVKLLLEKGADHTISNNTNQTPLFGAARHGHLEVVKLLLEKGADPTIADNDGWTPLRGASFNGYTEIVRLLLEQGIDPNVTEPNDWTPLNSASNKGHVEVVKLLLEHGADSSITNSNGFTPLNSASITGNVEIVKLLLERGADITIPTKDGWSPLYTAASNGHAEVVKVLLESGAQIAVSDKNQLTPLHNAAYSGHLEVVKILLESGFNITSGGKDSITALHNAAFNNHLEIIKLLIENGADCMAVGKDGITPLHNAAANGHLDVVKLLLKNGVDIMAIGKDGITPLHNAAFNGHVDMVKFLLENGASITDLGKDGVTPHYGPLHNAALNGHSDVAKLLVENGANVMGVSKDGITPLHNAAYNGHLDIARLLLENGANVTGLSDDEITPQYEALHNAALNGHLDVVKLLVENGANVICIGKDGITPLHNASYNGHLDIVKFLVDNGASVMDIGNTGVTPLHNAVINGHVKVVEFLLKNGASITALGADEVTPLHTAAYKGHVDIVKLLIENGANVTAVSRDGITPIHNAAFEGHLDIVKILLKNGADVVDIGKDGAMPYYGALHNAALNGHLDVAKLLVENGADVTAVGRGGITPLHNASRKDDLEMIKFLCEMGAKISITNNNGSTPVYIAAATGHVEVVKFLCKMGADITISTKNECTPLYIAASNGHIEVVKFLCKMGADITIPNKDKCTPLYIAASNGHGVVVDFLCEEGADVTIPDAHGWTPLHIAAKHGHTEIVKELCQAPRVNISEQDNSGRTPVFFASMYGCRDILDFLLSKCPADINTKDHYKATPLFAAIRRGHKGTVATLLASNASKLDSEDCFGRTIHFWAKRTGDSQLLDLIDLYATSASTPDGTVVESLADGPPTPINRSAWCDVCTISINYNHDHYNCAICDGGDFLVCMECFEFGAHCQDRSHTWDFVKGKQETS